MNMSGKSIIKKLSELPVGKQAIIRSFDQEEISIKFMEMGIIPGEEIKIEKVAPLGDPISVLVADYWVSLRLEEAQQIVVEEVIN
jgi:ferrous iron transport protein A